MSGNDSSFTQRSKDEIVSGGQTGALKDIDKSTESAGSKQGDGSDQGNPGKEDAADTIPQTGKPPTK